MIQIAARAGAERDRLRRMIEATLPVAKERALLLGELSAALARGDDGVALATARRLCGLPPVEDPK